MARKKKKNGRGDRKLSLSREAEDELVSAHGSFLDLVDVPYGHWSHSVALCNVQVALEAIFSTPDEDADGGNFRKHEDGLGFDLVVVPHPGDAEANFVWADIKIRFDSAFIYNQIAAHAW